MTRGNDLFWTMSPAERLSSSGKNSTKRLAQGMTKPCGLAAAAVPKGHPSMTSSRQATAFCGSAVTVNDIPDDF